MVTLYYLARFLKFFDKILSQEGSEEVRVSEELFHFFNRVQQSLVENRDILGKDITDQERKKILDQLGNAGSDYRSLVYNESYSGKRQSLSLSELKAFTKLTIQYLEHTISINKRSDSMYHAYNLMTVKGDEICIDTLDEMLEGQVAVLSSGILSPSECLALLDGLKSSRLFREDQYSYLLYPNKELPRFLDKNIISEKDVQGSNFLKFLIEEGNPEVVLKDINGEYHFNGDLKNADDLKNVLDQLSVEYEVSDEDESYVLQVFEKVFNHKAFTGRSGTFFGYEGLGSIYWHMVSKLLLAVKECCMISIQNGESKETTGRLLEHYYEIYEGIGVHKSPELYGAFPTDPYSHTPLGKGAQQPGMTGQVKEDILCRMGELGVFVENGEVRFKPFLLRAAEFLSKPTTFEYLDIDRKLKRVSLVENTLVFLYCQVPVVYSIAKENGLELHYSDGDSTFSYELVINRLTSQQLFRRTGKVDRITVYVQENQLK